MKISENKEVFLCCGEIDRERFVILLHRDMIVLLAA